MINGLIHLAFVIFFPPVLMGIIIKTKAAFAGRIGAPWFQPYYDLIKLIQKGTVFSETTTWVFRAGPVVGLAATLLAALLVPMGGRRGLFFFDGDFLLLIYLLGLSRFFTTAAAMDTGSPFEGMGAAREVTYACLAEPAFLFGVLVLCKLSGSLNLEGMVGKSLPNSWTIAGASLVLVVLSWFIVLLVENCRIPFDDPNTHLELTMIHEVMVLDHSGPAFGMILYGAAIKLLIYAAMIVRVALPWSTGYLLLDWIGFTLFASLLAAIVGVVESTMARLRLPRIPTFLIAASLFSAFGIILLMR